MADGFGDAYSILNLYPDCTIGEAREAYKAAALRHHPDRHPEHRKNEAQRRFKVYAEAYTQICADLGQEVDERDLAPPKVLTGLSDTPGALALRQASKSAVAHPSSAAAATPRAAPPPVSLALQRRGAPPRRQQSEPEYYEEPLYSDEAHEGEYDEPVQDEPEQYDEPADEYDYPVAPVVQPQGRRGRTAPPQAHMSQRPQMNGYDRAVSARQGDRGGGDYAPRGRGFDDDGFMDGFGGMGGQMDRAFGGMGGDMMGFGGGGMGGGMFGGGGRMDPFDQIGNQMSQMMGNMDIRDPSFSRGGGGAMQMRTRKMTMQENPDGSWTGQTHERSMRAGDGRVDIQEGGRQMHMPGMRGPRYRPPTPGGPGRHVADARATKSARPQESWDEPPPRYTDAGAERFEEFAADEDDEYLEGGDAYDDEYDQGGYDENQLVAAPAPQAQRQPPRRVVSAPVTQQQQALARRQTQPGGPPRGPAGGGPLVRSGTGPAGAMVRTPQGGRSPAGAGGAMTKTISPRSPAAAANGQMVRRPSVAVASRR